MNMSVPVVVLEQLELFWERNYSGEKKNEKGETLTGKRKREGTENKAGTFVIESFIERLTQFREKERLNQEWVEKIRIHTFSWKYGIISLVAGRTKTHILGNWIMHLLQDTHKKHTARRQMKNFLWHNVTFGDLKQNIQESRRHRRQKTSI
jgi:2-methylcitrate dehydratase PrpD